MCSAYLSGGSYAYGGKIIWIIIKGATIFCSSSVATVLSYVAKKKLQSFSHQVHQVSFRNLIKTSKAGWWYTYPSEKWWSESQLGFDDIPNWMESEKIPWFQTTNQIQRYLCLHVMSWDSWDDLSLHQEA